MKGDVRWSCPVCQRSKFAAPALALWCEGRYRMSHLTEPMVQR